MKNAYAKIQEACLLALSGQSVDCSEIYAAVDALDEAQTQALLTSSANPKDPTVQIQDALTMVQNAHEMIQAQLRANVEAEACSTGTCPKMFS